MATGFGRGSKPSKLGGVGANPPGLWPMAASSKELISGRKAASELVTAEVVTGTSGIIPDLNPLAGLGVSQAGRHEQW